MSGPVEVIKGGGHALELHHEYPLADLRPADYNPRRLSPEAFERLKESLDRWGVVKPVILNKGGTLVAGHQRTKALLALGHTTVPAVILSQKVMLQDEVRFNLLHNRVEIEASTAMIPAGVPGEWSLVDPEVIRVGQRRAPAFRDAMAQMISKHGPWGAVVCDDQGRVVLNTEYAVVCADMKMPMLSYTIGSEAAAGLYADLTGEYGVYDWSGIEGSIAPVHNQHYAQLHRLVQRSAGNGGTIKKGATIMRSTTWETQVLPWLTEQHRVADFGAGYGDYAKKLRSEGFQVWDYEPFRCTEGAYAIDIKQVVGMIRKMQQAIEADGLFDVVVLDSVINSITTREYQDAVLTVCNALTRRDGMLVLGTRSVGAQHKAEAAKRVSAKSGNGSALSFLDHDNVEFRFTKGKWGAQRYHSPESLTALLERFFEDVKLSNTSKAQMYAVCRRPRPLPEQQVADACNIEFNMPYPNDYRHNRHEGIVAALVARMAARDGRSVLD